MLLEVKIVVVLASSVARLHREEIKSLVPLSWRLLKPVE